MPTDPDQPDPVARATALVRLFHEPEAFGGFRAVPAAVVPEPARTLLDHRSHMTVAMERFHGGPVRLRVVATVGGPADRPSADSRYSREILLENRRGEIVQHGIVRIDLTRLGPATAAAILAASRPLGRILIEAGVLREIHGVQLLEVTPGPHLAALFGFPTGPSPLVCSPPLVYGRVADIQLDGHPAIELLELVAATGGRSKP